MPDEVTPKVWGGGWGICLIILDGNERMKLKCILMKKVLLICLGLN
jgi:hypothetical protein